MFELSENASIIISVLVILFFALGFLNGKPKKTPKDIPKQSSDPEYDLDKLIRNAESLKKERENLNPESSNYEKVKNFLDNGINKYAELIERAKIAKNLKESQKN